MEVFHPRQRAVQAQEAALGALNLPSAADIERLTRRLRSVSQRLEGIEDSLDQLEERLGALATGPAGERLGAIKQLIRLRTRLRACLHGLSQQAHIRTRG